MITYKYKLYKSKRNRELDALLREAHHDRDLLAANNILRRGIDELGNKINPQPSRAAVFVRA